MRRKSAKMRFVPSNLYKPRENCTLLQTFSFSYVCPQRPQFAVLTRRAVLATEKHNVTPPSFLEPLCPPTSEVFKLKLVPGTGIGVPVKSNLQQDKQIEELSRGHS